MYGSSASLPKIFRQVLDNRLREVDYELSRDKSLLHLTDEHGRTLLMYTAIQNNLDMARVLVKALSEEKLNVLDYSMNTALHYSVARKRLDSLPMIELLVSSKADIYLSNAARLTPVEVGLFLNRSQFNNHSIIVSNSSVIHHLPPCHACSLLLHLPTFFLYPLLSLICRLLRQVTSSSQVWR